jgi:uncharacterized protein YeaC (DUF1315 family)
MHLGVMLNGQIINVDVFQHTTVKQLKQVLNNKTGVPTIDIVISHNGNVMSDDRLLFNCGLDSGDVLNADVRAVESFLDSFKYQANEKPPTESEQSAQPSPDIKQSTLASDDVTGHPSNDVNLSTATDVKKREIFIDKTLIENLSAGEKLIWEGPSTLAKRDLLFKLIGMQKYLDCTELKVGKLYAESSVNPVLANFDFADPLRNNASSSSASPPSDHASICALDENGSERITPELAYKLKQEVLTGKSRKGKVLSAELRLQKQKRYNTYIKAIGGKELNAVSEKLEQLNTTVGNMSTTLKSLPANVASAMVQSLSSTEATPGLDEEAQIAEDRIKVRFLNNRIKKNVGVVEMNKFQDKLELMPEDERAGLVAGMRKYIEKKNHREDTLMAKQKEKEDVLEKKMQAKKEAAASISTSSPSSVAPKAKSKAKAKAFPSDSTAVSCLACQKVLKSDRGLSQHLAQHCPSRVV